MPIMEVPDPAGILRWSGGNAYTSHSVMYGTEIGTIAGSPNEGEGSHLGLSLTLDDVIRIERVAPTSTYPTGPTYLTIWLRTGSGATFDQLVEVTMGTNTFPLSSFPDLTEEDAADIAGISLRHYKPIYEVSYYSFGATAISLLAIGETITDTTPPVITPSVSGTMGDNGWYTSDATVSWDVSDAESDITSTSGCETTAVDWDTDGETLTCRATSDGGTSSESVIIKRDATPPDLEFAGNAGSYLVDESVHISCSASDDMSGLASSDCPEASGNAYDFGLGSHTLDGTATDMAGNTATASTTFSVDVDSESLCSLVQRWVTQRGVATSLCQQLQNGNVRGFQNLVRAQSGRHVPEFYASLLLAFSNEL
jgi:hypothetical protein